MSRKRKEKLQIQNVVNVDCLLSNYIMFEITSCTTSTTARSIIPKNRERDDFSML